MTREEFRRRLLRQGKYGAASDTLVDTCLQFQLEYGMDSESILEMQSTRFDLLVMAHNDRAKIQNDAGEGRRPMKKGFGYG